MTVWEFGGQPIFRGVPRLPNYLDPGGRSLSAPPHHARVAALSRANMFRHDLDCLGYLAPALPAFDPARHDLDCLGCDVSHRPC